MHFLNPHDLLLGYNVRGCRTPENIFHIVLVYVPAGSVSTGVRAACVDISIRGVWEANSRYGIDITHIDA